MSDSKAAVSAAGAVAAATDAKASGSSAKLILVTGGAGYIGSHTVVDLLDFGYDVVIVDNLVNATETSIDRIAQINKRRVRPAFHKIDLCDAVALNTLFDVYKQQGKRFDAVIHFAGLKAVGESVDKPLLYYSNNLIGTLNLLNAMSVHGDCRSLVFSSSATVYGDPESVPIAETARLSVTNAYGRTKLQIEDILRDTAKGADKGWRFVILRYFNPVGAHPSGLIGEDPTGIPNNLGPYISQVVVGRRPFLSVFGDDYNTPDGTGVRDYIHVVDLSRGHLAALHSPGGVLNVAPGSCESFNLGTGIGVSVKQLLAYFSKAAGKELPYKVAPRRPGDIATCYADPSKALKVLNWKCTHTIEQAVADGVRWQTNNPYGFKAPPTAAAAAAPAAGAGAGAAAAAAPAAATK